MINLTKLNEWLLEIKERPETAPLIVRKISNRLIELDEINEKLRIENFNLSTKHKTRQYESKIAELEYQLKILKRQLKNNVPSTSNLSIVNLLIYNDKGQVIRIEIDFSDLVSGATVANFRREATPEIDTPHLLSTNSTEELLLMFNSGRIIRLPVIDIPSNEGKDLDWNNSYNANIYDDEKLVVIVPIAKMSLFDLCIQTSRLGYTRKIPITLFSKHITRNRISTGINASVETDIPLNLTFCRQDDKFVFVSKRGYVTSVISNKLPISTDKAMRLDPDDHIIASFSISSSKQSLLFVTEEGRAIHYSSNWLKPFSKLGRKGQPLWSKSKRESGILLSGVIAPRESDWGVGLKESGDMVAVKINELAISKSTNSEHILKNIYPFSLLTFTSVNLNDFLS